MPIYTKIGDNGQSSLLDGKRVSKDNAFFQIIGDLDEFNAVLGLILSVCVFEFSKKNKMGFFEKLIDDLKKIQKDLFKLGAEIASLKSSSNKFHPDLSVMPNSLASLKLVDLESVRELENSIDKIWDQLPKLNNFILPGGCLTSAHLHLARAVCRRAERGLVNLGNEIKIRKELYAYINRLSDFLFVLARWVNLKAGNVEHGINEQKT
ncbi:MAG: cob(I)yrinic acid a,c-diamide adenosyltransferase [bacterium]